MTRRIVGNTVDRSVSRRVRVDPIEWAARRKKAMALAKTLREERKYGFRESTDKLKESVNNNEGSSSNELSPEHAASPRTKAVVTPLTEDDDTTTGEKPKMGTNHPFPVEDDYCRPISSSHSSSDTSLFVNNNNSSQDLNQTSSELFSANPPSSTCAGTGMFPARNSTPHERYNQQNCVMLPKIDKALILEHNAGIENNRCSINDKLLPSSSKTMLQRVECRNQAVNNQIRAPVSRACAPDTIPSTPALLESSTPKLSRARRKLQTALLYPLTEDTFNETGKLSLLQQRLMFRRKRAGRTNFKCEISASIRGKKITRKPAWVDSCDTPSPVNETPGPSSVAKFKQEREKGYSPDISSPGLLGPSQHILEMPPLKAAMETAPINNNSVINGVGHKLSAHEEYVEIERIHCDKCGKSFAPEVHAKICKLGKCIKMFKSKRKVFSSAKMRIMGNPHLNNTEKATVIDSRKKIVMEKKAGGGSFKRNKKHDKWKAQSADFREAMKANRLIARAQKEGKPAHYYL